MENHERRYTVAVYYRTRRLCYISVHPTGAAQYVSAYRSLVMDMYVCYCSSRHRSMKVIDMNSPLDGANDDHTAKFELRSPTAPLYDGHCDIQITTLLDDYYFMSIGRIPPSPNVGAHSSISVCS